MVRRLIANSADMTRFPPINAKQAKPAHGKPLGRLEFWKAAPCWNCPPNTQRCACALLIVWAFR